MCPLPAPTTTVTPGPAPILSLTGTVALIEAFFLRQMGAQGESRRMRPFGARRPFGHCIRRKITVYRLEEDTLASRWEGRQLWERR